ncbi:unnamed protein product [Rotaria sp. Silwood1]|nr:unnamed protein product [Rotaria sp. Silwood1]
MASTVNNDASPTVYRPIERHEYQQAFDLWYTVFKTAPPGFFERYLASEASPRYQINDTLGAWHDGKLVSAVHIRRLIFRLKDDNQEYLCAAISNVATLPEYRMRGYSRNLLRLALHKMENGAEFDMSCLDTPRHNHYSVLGWEQVTVPCPVNIHWEDLNHDSHNIEWRPASDVLLSDGQLLLKIYSNNPRAYQFDRAPLAMFQHWTGFYWRNDEAIICVLDDDEQGYVVIKKPNHQADVCISEWRAANIDVEKKLLKLAAIEIRRRHPQTKVIRLQGVPQYISLDELRDWTGAVDVERNPDTMFRNLRLPEETFQDVKTAFYSGKAIWWLGDYF